MYTLRAEMLNKTDICIRLKAKDELGPFLNPDGTLKAGDEHNSNRPVSDLDDIYGGLGF